MKQILLLMVFLAMVTVGANAQNDHRNCGMQEHMTELLKDEVYSKQHREMLRRIQSKIEDGVSSRAQCNDPVMIPMAVHYQRLKGKNYDKACLIALAQDQIDILNQDYGGYNIDISNWTNGSSSTFPGVSNGEACIEFCLATSNHPAGYDVAEGDPAVTFNKTSGDSDGNWSGYVNIFVRNISYLGYSPYGGQGNGDGVVIDNNAFGSGNGCGAVSPNAPYNLGRTLTHELGHYLLLDHIWGPGAQSTPNCNDSDLVGDTPNQSNAYGGCPTVGVSSCGSADLHMNYMDYSYDACMYMFTAGQATRMEAYVASDLSAVVANGLVVCGGSAPSCSDGVQNGQETGVDCGGPDCPPCNTSSCTDGIQNGQETGVDCGGPDCPPCNTSSCTDGIQNGQESGVDCGGPDCPPCNTGSCDAPAGLTSAKERGGSRLRLSWNSVGAATSYDVEIRESGTSTWNSFNTSSTTITISGLTKKSSYEWRVRSVCSGGVSPWATATAATRQAKITGQVDLYPNPSKNNLYINISQLESFNTATKVQLQVIDLTGRIVKSVHPDITPEISINVKDLSNGPYVLKIQLDEEVFIEKFMIHK